MSARSHPARRAERASGDYYCISSDLATFREICALVEGDSGVELARLRVQESRQGRARVELVGEFDAGVITALRTTLREVLSSADCLRIDLSRTTFLDELCVIELRRLGQSYPDGVSIVNKSWQAELSFEASAPTDSTAVTRSWSWHRRGSVR